MLYVVNIIYFVFGPRPPRCIVSTLKRKINNNNNNNTDIRSIKYSQLNGVFARRVVSRLLSNYR